MDCKLVGPETPCFCKHRYNAYPRKLHTIYKFKEVSFEPRPQKLVGINTRQAYILSNFALTQIIWNILGTNNTRQTLKSFRRIGPSSFLVNRKAASVCPTITSQWTEANLSAAHASIRQRSISSLILSFANAVRLKIVFFKLYFV